MRSGMIDAWVVIFSFERGDMLRVTEVCFEEVPGENVMR